MKEQLGFGFRPLPVSRLQPDEIVVDLFAGGGGASVGLEAALGRPVDISINHDADAIEMHAVNHPMTRHLCADIWDVNPREACRGHAVGWMHASPDCTHFSQAKGGQPRSRATRSLSWVVLRWAGTVRPRIISLENVREILKWGPLRAKRCPDTGRAVRLDGSVAAPGERVLLADQFLVPDRRHEGRTWSRFVSELRRMGYEVEWRRMRSCDYDAAGLSAGTSRERLYMIARRDGEPIRWPESSRGPGHRLRHVTAADCIDWSIPCPSIFERSRPLADATCRRIARGVQKYVIGSGQPFIVQCANASSSGIAPTRSPLATITAWPKGGSHALVTAFLEQANGGGPNGNPAPARSAALPLSTITASASQQRVVTAHLTAMAQNVVGMHPTDPLPTVLAGAARFGVVECTLSPEVEADALRVAAFMMRYHGHGGQWSSCADPLTSITTRDRLALVTATLQGVPYVIVDIGLRMLTPGELYRAQGFPAGYVIDRTATGRRLTKTAQVRMVGNSVSPVMTAALAKANILNAEQRAAA